MYVAFALGGAWIGRNKLFVATGKFSVLVLKRLFKKLRKEENFSPTARCKMKVNRPYGVTSASSLSLVWRTPPPPGWLPPPKVACDEVGSQGGGGGPTHQIKSRSRRDNKRPIFINFKKRSG